MDTTAMTMTPYKISTITATGSLNSVLNLDAFYEHFDVNDNIIYIEYGSSKLSSFCKGENPKVTNRKRKKNKTTKRFDNQITLIFRNIGNEKLKLTYAKTDINAKVFKNGNVQMTGLKSADQGMQCMNYIYSQILKHNNVAEANIVEDITQLKVASYNIQLINSDFRVNRNIIRNNLNSLMNKKYNLESLFEPCIYPGVKIKYMWNKNNLMGVCRCTKEQCTCKKITIAVFQSGCVIITGAQDNKQIDVAYEYFNNVLKDNEAEICRLKDDA
jgi:TATA-box binding protein (TBP) (component of TFIID and TFIIIB)